MRLFSEVRFAIGFETAAVSRVITAIKFMRAIAFRVVRVIKLAAPTRADYSSLSAPKPPENCTTESTENERRQIQPIYIRKAKLIRKNSTPIETSSSLKTKLPVSKPQWNTLYTPPTRQIKKITG